MALRRRVAVEPWLKPRARTATAAGLPGNSYVGPHGFRELFGWPTLVGRSRAAADPDLARALWERSVELTGTASSL